MTHCFTVDYKQLVSQYHKSQCAMKGGSSKKTTSAKTSMNYFAVIYVIDNTVYMD